MTCGPQLADLDVRLQVLNVGYQAQAVPSTVGRTWLGPSPPRLSCARFDPERHRYGRLQ
jgi:hypothetical protein